MLVLPGGSGYSVGGGEKRGLRASFRGTGAPGGGGKALPPGQRCQLLVGPLGRRLGDVEMIRVFAGVPSRERERETPELLTGYLDRIGKRGLLKRREELALSRRIWQGDRRAREELIG